MQNKITVWQRAFLFVLMMAEREAQRLRQGPDHEVKVWLCRRSIEYAMWADWQTHHSLKAQELIDARWVRQMKVNGVIYYSLTTEASSVMQGQWDGVVLHWWVQWNGQMPEQMLPGFDEAPF